VDDLLCSACSQASRQSPSQDAANHRRIVYSRGKHCLDEQKRKLMLEHFMGGSINPLGIENQLVADLLHSVYREAGHSV
jgi:hypothetical protein